MFNVQKYADRYGKAFAQLILLRDTEKNKYYNFFSLITLLPENIFSCKNTENIAPVRISGRYEFIIDRICFDSSLSAIEYYNYGDNITHIFHNNKEYDQIYDFCEIKEQEPEGVLIYNDTSTSLNILKELIPKYNVGTRVFYKICTEKKLQMFLEKYESDDVFNDFLKKITDVFRLQLEDKKEFWGSFILCMPDPIIKEFHFKLGKDSLLVSTFLRKNKKFNGLFLNLRNETRYGTGFFFSVPLDSAYQIVDIPNEPDTLHLCVYHIDSNGKFELLEEHKAKFIKKINFNIDIEEASAIYNIDGQNIEAKGRTTISNSVGDNETETDKIIKENEEKRYLMYLEKSNTFVYFDGSADRKEIAKKTISDILRKVRKRCIVCDPYFSYSDFNDYILSLTGINCLIQIITSENGIAKKETVTIDGKEKKELKGKRLNSLIENVKGSSYCRAEIECYVLKKNEKNSSPLHDRFIIVDDVAYLLGSSLNHYGERATTLYKVPSAKILIREAYIMMKADKSVKLNEWVLDR